MSNVEYNCPVGGERLRGTRFQAVHKVPCVVHFAQANEDMWYPCRRSDTGCRIAFLDTVARDAHETLDHV